MEPEYLEDFFIVATYPYNFSWSYTNKVENMDLYHFKYKDGYIMSINEILYLNIEGISVNFIGDKSKASKVEIEKTNINTNFRIKYQNSYIRHKNSTLYCNDEENTNLFIKDSTWIFIKNKIDYEHTFIVARYKEDINWTRYLPGKVIIYNKGREDLILDNSRGNITIIKLENIGREGNTYLRHIIDNYDTLSSRVTFLQGDPFPHSPDILSLICMSKDFENIQSLSTWYFEHDPEKYYIEKHLKYLNGARYAIYQIDKTGKFLEWKDGLGIDGINRYKRENKCKDSFVYDHFLGRCNMENKIKDIYPTIFCALFSIIKENIIANSKETYEIINRELLKNDKLRGLDGYILERLWYIIFN